MGVHFKFHVVTTKCAKYRTRVYQLLCGSKRSFVSLVPIKYMAILRSAIKPNRITLLCNTKRTEQDLAKKRNKAIWRMLCIGNQNTVKITLIIIIIIIGFGVTKNHSLFLRKTITSSHGINPLISRASIVH